MAPTGPVDDQLSVPRRFAVVAGAPRCGTTALSQYLAQRRDVGFSVSKEPHFFTLKDFSGACDAELHQAVRKLYIPRFFPHCTGGEALWAEGSVSFLYAPDAARHLLRVWPDAKFVIALRDPMAMLPSLHERNLYQGDETQKDFGAAWRLAPARARGEAVPPSCFDARMLRYDELARFGSYLQAFFEAVGRERCLVLLHEDLRERPRESLDALCGFLGLAGDGADSFPEARSGQRYRIGWLQRLLKRPPRPIRSVMAGPYYRRQTNGKAVLPAPKAKAPSGVIWLRKGLIHLNSAPSRRPAPPTAIQQEIRDALAGEIALLERLIGRDLGHWLRVEGIEPAMDGPARAREPAATLEQREPA